MVGLTFIEVGPGTCHTRCGWECSLSGWDFFQVSSTVTDPNLSSQILSKAKLYLYHMVLNVIFKSDQINISAPSLFSFLKQNIINTTRGGAEIFNWFWWKTNSSRALILTNSPAPESRGLVLDLVLCSVLCSVLTAYATRPESWSSTGHVKESGKKSTFFFFYYFTNLIHLFEWSGTGLSSRRGGEDGPQSTLTWTRPPFFPDR